MSDISTVGRTAEEVSAADPALRAYVRKAIAALLASSDFLEALPGHVRPCRSEPIASARPNP
jgi:hypothetical protein